MKNTVKIIIIVVTTILSSTITIMAYSYNSTDMVYTPSNSNWKVSNVSDAITDLHNMKTSDIYTTSERAIGKWIDGNTIYQKTYDNLTIQASNTSFTSTGIEIDGISRIVGCSGYDQYGSFTSSIICNIASVTNNKGTIGIQATRNNSGMNLHYLTLQYIK